MSTPAEIKKRLEQNWIRFLSEHSSALALDHIDGASPPSVFVGRFGYPKVKVGPMIPPFHGDTSVLDSPENWAGKSIENIANYRLSLIRGVRSLEVGETSGRFIENLQDLAMSQKPVESEAIFEKEPVKDSTLEQEIRLDAEAAPFGPAAPLKQLKLVASTADQRIESAYYDTDLKAADAIMNLYERGVETSRIQRVLSVGMLGGRKSRKLVPTRWSITATDDVISDRLTKKNDAYPSIDRFAVSKYSHLANQYCVILIPDDVWSFEMIEAWFTRDGEMGIGSDYEDARGLDHYPTIAGAYFSARLAVSEYLSKRRRKAAALVLREIRPEYVMPLGVWQIREGVREALKDSPANFETLMDAISYAANYLSVSRSEIMARSLVYKNLRSQKRITDFA
jgi:hypothetical protein